MNTDQTTYVLQRPNFLSFFLEGGVCTLYGHDLTGQTGAAGYTSDVYSDVTPLEPRP